MTTRIAPSAAPEAAISQLVRDGGQVVDAERQLGVCMSPTRLWSASRTQAIDLPPPTALGG